jgi:hypothetical protein
MTLSAKIHVGLLTVGVLLVGWQFQQQLQTRRQLAAVQTEIRKQGQKLESRRAVLAALEQRNGELVEAERRAGNGTLLSLMRERAVATRAAADDASQSRSFGTALASVLDSPEQGEIDREHLRSDMRANLNLFFSLLNLPAEKREQFMDLQIEMERRKSIRIAALLRGNLALADALRERDNDEVESHQRMREVLGTEGYAFRESIGDGMRNTEARRLLSLIQQNMGGDTLNQEQSDQLQSLMKAELCTIPLDDTDLFRSPEDWTQIVSERQQNVLRGAAEFLTPAQMETLRALTAADLAQRRGEMILKRKALGIK